MSRLRKKYKKAERMVEINNLEFAEIDKGVSDERRLELENMEREAHACRIGHPEAMDIYAVQMQKRMP